MRPAASRATPRRSPCAWSLRPRRRLRAVVAAAVPRASGLSRCWPRWAWAAGAACAGTKMADAGAHRAGRLPWLVAGIALAAVIVQVVPDLRSTLLYDRLAVSQ